MKKKIAKRATAGACALTLCAAMALTLGAGGYSPVYAQGGALDRPEGGNYFLSDYGARAELDTAADALSREIMDESVVLLKNDDNFLPIREGTPKVSIFGKNSTTQWGVCSASEFRENNMFEVNNALVQFYNDNSRSGDGIPSENSGTGSIFSGMPTGETPVEMYTNDTGNVTSSFEEYSDLAIVYFYRTVGEGRDAPRTSLWDGESYLFNQNSTQKLPNATSADDHYMELDKNEKDLLAYVCGQECFEDVIVVITSGSQIETDFLEDPAYNGKIKAAMWAGSNIGGYSAVPKVIKGQLNPSGRTVDTWSRDFTKDPTWQNFGTQLTYNGNQYTNLTSTNGSKYVIYKEGIYIGYRYYETRGYEEEQDGNAGWYDENVNYPFGYGLSYTTFEKKIVSSTLATEDLSALDKIDITVEVTNNGQVAGKDVVQIYYTAPYKEGGIEKPYVVLGGFAKTDLLEPGHSQQVTISLNVKDMASYDYSDANTNGFKGYELDSGDYYIRLMENAHEEIASVKYNLAEGIQYPTAEGKTDNNLFDDVSNYLTDELGEKYMSRADFEGTFPTQAKDLALSQEHIAELNEWAPNGTTPSDEGRPYYSDTVPAMGEGNGIVLSDLFGKDYNDPMWSDFLDQLTADQLVYLATNGSYWSGMDIPKLGITRVANSDGVGGLFAYSGTHDSLGSVSNQSWGAQVRLAATWNKELAYRKGRIIGNEGLWGGSNEYSMLPGYYSPGVNIHRSTFSGRNTQYFSEDGYFTGIMAAQLVKGANEMGMFTYVKHFGLNEQESNRIGVMTWANEQSMREIYFKGFELCVTEGKTTAMMSSLNRIGTTWAGGDYRLLTSLLRDEWGFNGCVVTDSFIGNYSNADQMIRAGGNLALGTTNLADKTSATALTCLREMAHGLLYTHANSMAINEGARPIVASRLLSYRSTVLPTGAINAQYSGSVATAALNPDYENELTPADITYSLAEGSLPLPAGLTLNADGTITGTPTQSVEDYRITAQATCGNDVLTATFTLNITEGDPQLIYSAAQSQLPAATIGAQYSQSVATAEIFAPNATPEEIEAFPDITYALANGSSLPAGLRLTQSGEIIGTPAVQYANCTFAVVALADGMESRSQSFSISVMGSITFAGGTLKAGTYAQSYVDSIIPAAGGNATYSLKDGSALPNGLTLTPGGYVVGTPTQVVTDHKFTVIASCDNALPVEAEYSITIGINYLSVDMPDGTEGAPYNARIDMAQGAGEITYTVSEGSLPEGLALSSDGAITGTPVRAGVYTFTVAANADGMVGDTTEITIYVANAAVQPVQGDMTAADAFMLTVCAGGVAVLVLVVIIISLAIVVFKKSSYIKNSANGRDDGNKRR